ncbi:MAG: hypothetical protein GY719_34195 [bacterium]|nr:hypothetical protein [bacterium]
MRGEESDGPETGALYIALFTVTPIVSASILRFRRRGRGFQKQPAQLRGEYEEKLADLNAYIKDPRAGTFQHLVTAAERCTAAIIHPGTPLDPDEEDLEKWVRRAERFN